MRRNLLYLALKYNGNVSLMIEAIKRKETPTKDELEGIESNIHSKYVTLIDEDYPNCFKYMATPPIVLFYHGDLSLISYPGNRKIAIIGKRECSDYGKINTTTIVAGLKSYNCVVVSGMAKGIDSIAHQVALDNNIKTIAVLGSGINNPYPINNRDIYEQIKEKGLVISEYPEDITPEPENFLIRNRLIASISDKIAVMEADYKSGTMNTVAYGLDIGKDIFAVPYMANTRSGCNRLIKEGAKLIENADDLFE